MSNARFRSEESELSIIYSPQLDYISYSKYEGDWNSQFHSHTFMEIAFAVGGAGTVYVEEGSFPVEEGKLIIIPPNRLHTEVSSSENALEYYILGVRNFTFSIFGNEENFTSPVLNLGKFAFPIKEIFIDMFEEMKLKKTGYEIMVQSLLLKLFALITRITDLSASFNNTEEMRRGCAIVKEYIDTHYADKITLEDLTKLSCISKYHLIHEFTKYVGTSPIAYQLKRRIQEAIYLLESTDNSIADIAFSLGFSSMSHFSQRFKAETGYTPLKYKQKMSKRSNGSR